MSDIRNISVHKGTNHVGNVTVLPTDIAVIADALDSAATLARFAGDNTDEPDKMSNYATAGRLTALAAVVREAI